MPAATVTTTVAVAYTANIGVTRRPRWSHRSKATTKSHQATPGFPRPQAGGEFPRVLPWAHHVHIHDASPEWYSRTSSSLRDRASRPSFPSPHYHEGHAWGSPHAVCAEASTPQTTSFPGRLTEVRTPEVATRLHVRLRVGRLTLELTVAGRWECSQATGFPPGAIRISAHHSHAPQDMCICMLSVVSPSPRLTVFPPRGDANRNTKAP